jgi:hypothetical protein
VIPEIGEVYEHEDGSVLGIVYVAVSKTFEVEMVGFTVETDQGVVRGTFDAAGWKLHSPKLRKVPPAPPEPVLPKLQLVDHILPDLRLMQALDRFFGMSVGDVSVGYIGKEDVCVLVARGELADQLKQIGLKIHRILLEQKSNGTKDPQEN